MAREEDEELVRRLLCWWVQAYRLAADGLHPQRSDRSAATPGGGGGGRHDWRGVAAAALQGSADAKDGQGGCAVAQQQREAAGPAAPRGGGSTAATAATAGAGQPPRGRLCGGHGCFARQRGACPRWLEEGWSMLEERTRRGVLAFLALQGSRSPIDQLYRSPRLVTIWRPNASSQRARTRRAARTTAPRPARRPARHRHRTGTMRRRRR